MLLGMDKLFPGGINMRFDYPKHLRFLPNILERSIVGIVLLFQFCIPVLFPIGARIAIRGPHKTCFVGKRRSKGVNAVFAARWKQS